MQHAVHHAVAAAEMKLVSTGRTFVQGVNDYLLQAQARAMEARFYGFFWDVQTLGGFGPRHLLDRAQDEDRSEIRPVGHRWRVSKRRAAVGR